MPAAQTQALYATGTTATPASAVLAVPSTAQWVALEFIIEAVGGTPTITWKLQGSFSTAGTPAGAFVDCQLLPSASDTSVASVTQTGTGTYVHFVSLAHSRQFRYYQCVTSANTNVTYRANLWSLSVEPD